MPGSETPKLQLYMSKGSGADSYYQNSTFQKVWIETIFGELDEALGHVVLPHEKSITIADLGCSSGPNTIRNVNRIMQTLRARTSKSSLSSSVTFQAFFNDLPGTDFNTLFQLLTAEKKSDWFVAGVPGSFGDRLFPKSSINVFFSSLAAHWLSKIPDSVLDKNSPAYNKDSDWLLGANAATVMAYKEQASEDLKRFLRLRATELAPGGLLFVAIAARNHDDHDRCKESDLLFVVNYARSEAWKELVSKGIVDEDKLGAYNTPLYFRTKDEVLEDASSCREYFEVKKVELLNTTPLVGAFSDEVFEDPGKLSEALAQGTAGAYGGMIESHFGKETFETYLKHLKPQLLKHVTPKATEVSALCIISLIRRGKTAE